MLDAVTDDVDWAAETTSTVAPWYGVRHGKQGVAEFFEAFGSTMEVEEFSPTSYTANDTEVLTVVQFRAKARGTGRTSAMQLRHIFKFRDGKICYYRGS
jgi:ketosteroid isomerase-like protein